MIRALKVRPVMFALGVAGILLSLSAFVGSYFRHVDTTDYFKQADEGVPWVEFGLASSTAGFVFSFFGRRWQRAAAVGLSLLLLILWFFVAESLY
jgi:hypothetical protein